MLKDYFSMSLRSLARRRLRSWLTLLGIVIGITSVVALVGLGQGLEAAISNIFGTLGTDKLSVTATGGFGPPGTAVVDPLTTDNLETIRDVNGVEYAAGRLVKAGKLTFNDKVAFGYAGSIPDEDNEGYRLVIETLDVEAAEGRILEQDDRGRVMVGSALGEMESYFGKDITAGSEITIQDTRFEVVGVLEKTGSPILDMVLVMRESEMREVFDLTEDELDIIAVQVENENEMADVKEDIEHELRKARDVDKGEEDFSVSSPEEALESVNSTLGAVNLFVYVIAGISIVVGGIGIMNTMFMSVTERTRDIGIMKSIGARNSTIFTLFFIESGLLGSIGGLAGATFGAVLAMIGSMGLQSFLGGDIEVSAQIDAFLFLGSVFGAFIIGSLFGIIPAMQASRMHPVEALRHKK